MTQNPTFHSVSKWNAKPVFLAILAGSLVVIGLILVLPQVDLLDTAFHRGSSPVAARARFASAPSPTLVTPLVGPGGGISFAQSQLAFLSVPDSAEVASSVLCNFRC